LGGISMHQRSMHMLQRSMRKPSMPRQPSGMSAEFRRPSSAGVRHSLLCSGAAGAAAVATAEQLPVAPDGSLGGSSSSSSSLADPEVTAAGLSGQGQQGPDSDSRSTSMD
jgi:hypothetical protein